jgi:arylsulfatase A-like enzyme/Flp pilus assembly protein TadD
MRLFRQFLLILIVAQSAAAAGGPKVASRTPSRTAKLPNIILITLDTTRADRMGFLGSKRGLTPNLDALARESAVFTHAYAQVPLTTPSHATILTGTYPQFHGLIDFPMALPADVPYGPEILHSQGYRTGAFVGSMALAPGTLAPGFERGFDTYDADFHPENLGQKKYHKKERYHTLERPGDEVLALALAWLDKQPKTPFFLWVHLYDAHAPYEPPEPYQTRYASEPYDGEIAYEDAAVGGFLRQLKARKLYDGTVIAVMADHGESLGAHGEQEHGVFLYDETIHVPLLVKLPHGAGKRIESRVELADVMPTVLEAVKMTVPPAMQGESLLGLIKAGDDGAIGGWRDRPAYSQTDYTRVSFHWSALQSWRTDKYLYIEAPRRELYDQTADPKTEQNLASSSPAVAHTLAAKLESFRGKTIGHREAVEVTLNPEMQQQLAALGYATSDSYSSKPSDRGPDPKDRIEALHLMEKLRPVLEDARFEEAIPLLQEAIEKEPDIYPLRLKLAGCYMNLKQYKKAVPALRKALEVRPGDIEVEMNLGKALLETQDFDGATTVFEDVVARTPENVMSHAGLEIAYFGTNRFSKAIKECELVLAVSPDDYDSYIVLGLSLSRSGDLEAAVPKLQKAAALRPTAPKPHMFLATVYTKLGRDADAERERAEGIHLGAKPSVPANPAPDVSPSSAEKK